MQVGGGKGLRILGLEELSESFDSVSQSMGEVAGGSGDSFQVTHKYSCKQHLVSEQGSDILYRSPVTFQITTGRKSQRGAVVSLTPP